MRTEFESPEQMDLSQPGADFALNQNLKGFKINRKTLTRAALPVILGVAAATAGAVTGIGSSSNVDTESTPGSPRSPLVTHVPTACILPTPAVEMVNEPPIVTIALGAVSIGANYAPKAEGSCSNEPSQPKTFPEVADLNAKPGEKGYVYNYEFESDRDYFDVAGYYAVPKKERVTIPERTVRVWDPILGRYVDWQAPETTYEVTHYQYFPIDQCNSGK